MEYTRFNQVAGSRGRCRQNNAYAQQETAEKFACIAVCEYFRKLELQAEFVEDMPCFEDL